MLCPRRKKLKPNPIVEEHSFLFDQDIWAYHILPYLGPGCFIFVALIAKRFRVYYRLFFESLALEDIPALHGKFDYVDDFYKPYTFSRRELETANMRSSPRRGESGPTIRYELPLLRKPRKIAAFHTSYAYAFSSESCFAYWFERGNKDYLKDRMDLMNLFTDPRYPKDAFTWAHDKKYKFNPRGSYSCTLARHGDFEKFKTARSNGMKYHPQTAAYAAEGGNKDILEFLFQTGGHDLEASFGTDACARAARFGRLEILKMLRETGYDWNDHVLENAARAGHLTLFKWAELNGAPGRFPHLGDCIKNGHLEILQYVHGRRPQNIRFSYMHFATSGGHLEIVKFLHSIGHNNFTGHHMKNAVQSGNLALVKYLHAKGCPIPPQIDEVAAAKGHVDVLKYFHDLGHPWSENTMYWAAESGSAETFQYAHDNGCAWHVHALRAAAKLGNRAILEYVVCKMKGMEDGAKIKE